MRFWKLFTLQKAKQQVKIAIKGENCHAIKGAVPLLPGETSRECLHFLREDRKRGSIWDGKAARKGQKTQNNISLGFLEFDYYGPFSSRLSERKWTASFEPLREFKFGYSFLIEKPF